MREILGSTIESPKKLPSRKFTDHSDSFRASLELAYRNIPREDSKAKRARLVEKRVAENRIRLLRGIKNLESQGFSDQVNEGVYAGAGKEWRNELDDAREVIVPAYSEIFRTFSQIKPVKEQKNILVRRLRKLEKEHKMEEASKVWEEIKNLQRNIDNFWKDQGKNIAAEWKKEYEIGTYLLGDASMDIGD